MTDEKMHTRKSDEELLMQFILEAAWDEADLVDAVYRLRECHEKGLQDYAVREGE